jgi:hypothetical protein
MFLGWFLPAPVRWLGRPALHAIMEPALLDAVGFPEPGPLLRRLVAGSLRTRGRLIARLPARRGPRHRTEIPHRSYPRGYDIEALGPPPAGRG